MNEDPHSPDAASHQSQTVRVELAERSYDVVIGAGLIAQAGERLAALMPGRPVVAITDETVAGLYLETLEGSLTGAGIAYRTFIVPPGEASKSFAGYEKLAERILAAGIGRDSIILALGGGVVGDLAGFLAATLLRGLDFVQLPTTLLAQVDSAVGGKTGIDTPQGKNLIGAFHQPRLVLADIAALETLPQREVRAGYAETVKYGLIGDGEFFTWCETNAGRLLAGERDLRAHAVRYACRAKAAIVAEDEREAGKRALLNLGHTFGHALEAETGFGDTLLHGEAVAIGACIAFDLSAELGYCPAGDAARVRAHLDSAGLPTGLDTALLGRRRPAAEAIVARMASDKKTKLGALRLVLARGIGKAFVAEDVDPAMLRDFLGRAAAA
ncbi:MAG: 3-dehydroquinate synthase [Alphaproteobacteria bacterium]